MHTAAFHPHPVGHGFAERHHTTPMRIMDFVLLALIAVALAFAAVSDKPPVRTAPSMMTQP